MIAAPIQALNHTKVLQTKVSTPASTQNVITHKRKLQASCEADLRNWPVVFLTFSISQTVPRWYLITLYREERKALQVYWTEFLQHESNYFPSVPHRLYSGYFLLVKPLLGVKNRLAQLLHLFNSIILHFS